MCSGSGLWDGWICWFQGDLWRWYGSDMELYSATRWDDLLTSTWPWFLELLKKLHHWRCCQHEAVKWLPHKHHPGPYMYIYIYIYHRPDISRYMISDIDTLVSGSLNSHQSFILAFRHMSGLSFTGTNRYYPRKGPQRPPRRFQKIPRTITSLPLPRPSWKSMMNMADLCLISVRKEPWASEWRANF